MTIVKNRKVTPYRVNFYWPNGDVRSVTPRALDANMAMHEAWKSIIVDDEEPQYIEVEMDPQETPPKLADRERCIYRQGTQAYILRCTGHGESETVFRLDITKQVGVGQPFPKDIGSYTKDYAQQAVHDQDHRIAFVANFVRKQNA